MTLTWWRFWVRQTDQRDTAAPADWMLRRKDDRWLDDIGLTRQELREMLDQYES
ncbi:hypothetical protein OU426_08860 [Frigidibacter sp. RF13]|uniref:hypothetical protein n=1 Tax=Frigidibacter sp. RF13 TaxID=2997340 RepID=UPI00226F40CE|nr:hypothetical protein [Frigidibacter sp. RF13]MCY1126963.1 hypothetical protein [Frigidibacter sp. RF13]